MGKLLILGGGTAGTMAANHMRSKLDISWEITVVDQNNMHHYQPGYLFVPFWMKPDRVVRERAKYFHEGIDFIQDLIKLVKPESNTVELGGGRTLDYDWLVIATGTRPVPEAVAGMAEELGKHSKVFQFYTLEGAKTLRKALRGFKGGKLLVHISEMPIKCPVAPLEFTFLVEDFFRKQRIRHKVDITFVTPLDGAFTKPVASKELGNMLEDRSIRLAADFQVESVGDGVLASYDGRELPFDMLVTIPPNQGQQYVINSGIGDASGFVECDMHTLRANKWDNVFVLGDAGTLPTSKAGSVAHFSAEIMVENLLAAIKGEPLPASFDGHANCFVETGRGEAMLLDFNYETQPLLGKFPLPAVGPMSLLKPTHLNHMGKLAFEQMYWNMLLPGRPIPIPSAMQTAGKKFPKEGE